MSWRALLYLSVALSLAKNPAQAEARAPLSATARTNGAQTLAAVAALQQRLQGSSTKVIDSEGLTVSAASWVGAEGYFLTKASDTPQLEKCKILIGPKNAAAIREIHRSVIHDLVLAQAVGVSGLPALSFETKAKSTAYGQWLIAPVKGGQEVRIGVVSALRRKIPGNGAAMGVRMDDRTPGGKGVRVSGVAEDSPAAAAGLMEDDVLISLDGKLLNSYQTVHDLVRDRQPGEQIELAYRRAGKEGKVQLRLASRSKILQNWEGEDFANGGISIRTDNFAQVIQHDLPLSAQDMGSPLFDLEGHLLGINIARVDRITTFALPVETFWPTFLPYLEADRHPPKAVKAVKTE
jgi:serine protease Do